MKSQIDECTFHYIGWTNTVCLPVAWSKKNKKLNFRRAKQQATKMALRQHRAGQAHSVHADTRAEACCQIWGFTHPSILLRSI
mmetsp:Transcript_20923/g.58184  ORF Transcript_20923/g.58184 Transcript_20923/m.58184 type:complete len:83 (+) Transcript_20923:324-572(+)